MIVDCGKDEAAEIRFEYLANFTRTFKEQKTQFTLNQHKYKSGNTLLQEIALKSFHSHKIKNSIDHR